ncbi:hypothetical protein [Deinococcus sp. Marseille-Q6407]|uniref:hypothetical protein n=1 Tax=Deinococcus sp. Marseille-Q6407 TaxID=2969223 RepID=UPI0021BF9C8C|nr:hypothetical protein [Deinococcus sp. Marseille-Q6407]
MSANDQLRSNRRTLPLLFALVLPSAALACSPAEPMIQTWDAGTLPHGWESRPCSADWQRQAGEFGRVSCYQLPAGTSTTRIAQDAWLTTLDQLLVGHPGPQHQRLTRTFGSEEVLDIYNKGQRGIFVNSLWQRPAEAFLRDQLRGVAQAAQKPGAQLPAGRPAWLGDERRHCSELAPLDHRFFASCRAELRTMQDVDITSASGETRLAPLLTFRLRAAAGLPAELTTPRDYAAYLTAGGGCAETRVAGLNAKQYAGVWPLY